MGQQAAGSGHEPLAGSTGVPLVTVIVPVYNAAATLGRFLDSLAAQDYPQLEVVFIDDGSTDASVELLRARGFQPVLSPRNQGQSLARNLGLAHSQGELVCFFDSDVILRPDTVRRLVATLDRHGCDAVSGNYEIEPADQRLTSRFYSFLKSFGHGERPVMDHNILGTYCCIVRRDCLQRVGGFRSFPPGMDIECEEIGRRLSRAGCRFAFDPGIRIGHHFGGFRKILYVFSNRVYWYARYKVLVPAGKEALGMRGASSAAAVGAYTLFALTLPVLALAALLVPDGSWPVAVLAALAAGGLVAGTLLMGGFLRFCLKRAGLGFTLAVSLLSPFFFAVAGICGALGAAVSLLGRRWPRRDQLFRLLQP